MSGSGTTTWRSKRPGRSSAGSSTSGRLVAAITITPAVRLEAVHLDQQLVQRLLALVVAAAEARAALAADRVDFVDEHDAGRVLLRLLEHVAHARRADADEHLDEIGTGNREERHLGLAGDGPRQQRLAGAGIADHQHAARNAPAELLELGRDRAGSRPVRRLPPSPRRNRRRRRRSRYWSIHPACARGSCRTRTRRRGRRPASGA